MSNKFMRKLISVLWIVLCLQAASFAYAQGGEQAPSPRVPGQNPKPLHLSAVTLVDGGNVQDAADIPLEAVFKCQFDKNVVNSLIWEGNSRCFSLISADNENLPVRVTKVDDTIDFTQRQNIFVQPVNPLKPGTAYYLKISPALQAKNGISLGGTKGEAGITVAFKTKGTAPVQLPGPAAATTGPEQTGVAKPSSVSANSPLATTDRTKVQEQPPPPSEQNNSGQDPAVSGNKPAETEGKPQNILSNLSGWITPIGAFCIMGWILFEIYIKRKAKIKS